ncbi:MAG TPA: fibronectin type III domain-containing protein, partial [Acidimicrobiales bacterium]|nr:fibronectin type III domain-containing protein [Acidimicrobiales bacterium]
MSERPTTPGQVSVGPRVSAVVGERSRLLRHGSAAALVVHPVRWRANLVAALVLVMVGGLVGVVLPARAGGTASSGLQVQANAAPPGLDTGVLVSPVDSISISASGSATYGNEGGNCSGVPSTDPDGNRTLNGTSCGPKLDPNALDPSAPIGSLVGQIGTGSWFLVGSQWTDEPGATTSGAGQTGEMHLAYNDDYGPITQDASAYSNNTGSFIVQVAVTLPVPAVVGPPGVSAGILVLPGESYSVTGTGAATYGTEGGNCAGVPSVDPNGNRTLNGISCGQKIDPSATLGTAPIGALIAQAGTPGSGGWFLVGSSFSTTATDSICGFLSFLVNDSYNADDTGQYNITVTLGSAGTTGSGGTPPAPTSSLAGKPPAVTSALYTGTDSTGGHTITINGSGLADVQTIIYGKLNSPTTLPAPCPEVAGTLVAATGPCSYTVQSGDRLTGTGSDTELEPTAPPQADLSHVMVISPVGRSNTFAVTGVPAEPALSGASIIGTDSDGSHQVLLWGQNLANATDVTYGTIDLPAAPLACAVDATGNLQPAAETCSYGVQSSDLSDNPWGAQSSTNPFNFVVPAPPGADLTHITVFGPGGWSNSEGVNLSAPSVSTSSGVLNGDGSGTLYAFGSNLSGITDVLYGTPIAGEMPTPCPYNSGGLLPLPITQGQPPLPCVTNYYITPLSPTELTIGFPAGADVSHVVLLGPGGPSNAFSVTLPNPPVLTSLQAVGTEPDGRPEVELTGQNLSQVSVVDFGSTPSPTSSTRVLSDTEVETEVPETSGSVQVVATGLGGASNALSFTNADITSTSLGAARGTDPNPYLMITGDGLTSGGTPQVFFGNIPSPNVTVSGSGVQAEVPNLVPGDQLAQYVVVRTPNGDTPNFGDCPPSDPTATTPADCFLYPGPNDSAAWAGEFGPPVLISTSWSGMPGPNPILTLTGSGFTGASQVEIGQVPLSACAASQNTGCFYFFGDQSIIVMAPSQSPGSYPVTVSNPVGTSNSLDVSYTAAPPPPPSSGGVVTPVSGPPSAQGPPTSANPPSGQGPSFGPFSTQGTWSNNGHGVYTATGTVTVNGLEMDVPASGSVVLDTNAGTLTATGTVTVKLAAVNVPGIGQVGPFTVYSGSFQWTLSAGSIPIDLSSADIGGFSLGSGGSIVPPGSSGPGGTAPSSGGLEIAGQISLPGMLGGGTAQATFQTTSAGIDPSSLTINLNRLSLGGLITCDGCSLQYNASAGSWYVDGNLSGPNGTQITGSLTIAAGTISSGTIRVTSTSLAGLVGVNQVEIDYQSGGSDEHWSGQATDTSGATSSFDFHFANGTLQSGSVKVPHASFGGVLSVSNLDFEYSSGSWSLTTDAAASGIASLSGNLNVSYGVVQSGSVRLHSPALGTLLQIPDITLIYDGSQTGTDKWSGSATDASGNPYSFAFSYVDGALSSGSLDVPSASVAGVIELSNVQASFDGTQWGGQAGLTGPGGSSFGTIVVHVAYDASGSLVEAHLGLTGGQFDGVFNIQTLTVDYDSSTGLIGGGIALQLPFPQAGQVTGSVHFQNGGFHDASLGIVTDIPLAPGVDLTGGEIGISVDPLTITGGISIGAGPITGSAQIGYSASGLAPMVATPDGSGGSPACSYPSAAQSLSGTSDLNLCANLSLMDHPFDSTDVNLAGDGTVSFNGSFSFTAHLCSPLPWPFNGCGDIASFTASLDGYIHGSSDWGATATATLHLLGWNPQGSFAFSNAGLEACADTGVHLPFLGDIEAGVHDRWGQLPQWWGSCDVGSVSVTDISSHRIVRPDGIRGLTVVNNPTFTVGANQQAAAFAIAGQGGLASFKLVGPDGTSIDIPSTTPSGTLLDQKVFVLEDRVSGTTYMIVASPAPGTWTTSPDAGSVPLAGGQQASVVATPSVTASVSSAGGVLQDLNWTASDSPGDQVILREQGTGVASQTLSTSSSTSGTVQFSPADGPAGTRQIVAEVDRGGLPVSVQTVATYTAPAPTVPGAPTDGTWTTNAAGHLVVGWSPPAYDGGSPIIAYALTDGGTGAALATVSASDTTTTLAVNPNTAVDVQAVNTLGAGPALPLGPTGGGGVGIGSGGTLANAGAPAPPPPGTSSSDATPLDTTTVSSTGATLTGNSGSGVSAHVGVPAGA